MLVGPRSEKALLPHNSARKRILRSSSLYNSLPAFSRISFSFIEGADLTALFTTLLFMVAALVEAMTVEEASLEEINGLCRIDVALLIRGCLWVVAVESAWLDPLGLSVFTILCVRGKNGIAGYRGSIDDSMSTVCKF